MENRGGVVRYPREGAPKLGVLFPQTAFFGLPDEIRSFARDVEKAGFHHIMAYDHVLGVSPEGREDWWSWYDADAPFQEPFSLFSFMSAVAPTLDYASNVIILPQRQTVLVAKQAANLDYFTQGRFRLGVGLGWNPVEYESLNEDLNTRARRFPEQIELIRALTGNETVDFTGQWHRVDRAGLRPMSVQRPVPIWVGARVERAIRRGVRLGDGFMLSGTTVDDVTPALGIVRDELDRLDRDYRTFGVDARVSIVNRPDDAWKRDLERLREADVSHVTLVTLESEYSMLDEHLERMMHAREVWHSLT